jgi:hypothetical protein
MICPHGEFDVDEGANFKVEEKDQDHTQQEDHHSPLQDDQGPTQQENHHSPPQDVQDLPQHENQDNPHHDILVSLDTIIHHETLIKIILQDTLYNDPFLYVCHSSRSHDEKNHLIHLKIKSRLPLDMG